MKKGILIEKLVDDVFYLYNSNINSNVLVISKEIANIVKCCENIQDIDRFVSEYEKEKIKLYIDILERYNVYGTPSKKEYITNRLLVWLGITNNCNLRCKYCYIDKSDIAMNTQIIDKIIDKLRAIVIENNYEELVVKFSGGEPLLNLDIIKYTIQKLNAMLSIKRHYEILTNGILVTKELIDYALKNRISISISLDGNDGDTNQNRVDGLGNNYYDIIVKSIYMLKENGINPNIMLTVNGDNVKHLPEITSSFIDNHYKFRYSLEKDATSGGPRLLDFQNLLIQQLNKSFDVMEDKIMNGNLNWKFKFADVKFGYNRGSICSAGRDYIAFSADGKVGCCGMGLSKAKLTINDDKNLINELRKDFFDWSVEKYSSCKSCEWKRCCAGGCPLQNSLIGECSQGVYCDVFKSIIPRLLRTDALRIYIQNKVKK